MRTLMVLGAVVLVAGLAQAGTVPDLLNYQSRLTDDAGDFGVSLSVLRC